MTTFRQLARNHDFTVLWVGETISALGTQMSLFVFPLITYALTHSTLAAALVEALELVGMTAVLLPAGVWADRFDRRRLMLLASATGALGYGSLTVAGVLGLLTVPHLAVVALVTGLGAGLFSPAEMSAVRTVVPDEDLPTALSQNQAREHVASLVGGPLGGLLLAVTRWLPFAVDAVSYAVSCFTLTRIRADLSAPAFVGERPSMRRQLAEGLRFMMGRPFFRVLLSWAALANLMGNAVFFVVLMSLVRAGYPAWQLGLISTAAGVGGILGALAAPRLIDRLPTGALTVVVAWMCVVPLLPLVWVRTPWSAVAAVFALMLINPAGNAGISSYRVAVTPGELQGRVSATSRFLAMSVMPLSPVLGGLLLTTYGAGSAVIALIAGTTAAALLITSSRSVRRVPRPRDWKGSEELLAV
ncbi:MAG: MFS transporter [Nocardioidaceae bacterium]